jgi:tetratricopeptide (TPR) repeat protein
VFFILGLLVSRWEYVLRILILGLFLSQNVQAASSDSEAVEKFNAGTQYYQQHFFPKAVELFQESALMHSDNAFKRKAYFNLGNTYYSLNQMEEALQLM